MPAETKRVIKRKQIPLPSGGTVNIAVINQITFLDVVNAAQESEFHLENGSAGKRDVRVASIPGNGGATDETGGGSGLRVERVDTWRVLDVVERGQETDFHPDSKTVNSSGPKYFTTHEKTRVVKYINSPDDGNWIKSELIDQWKYADTVEQGQETEYFLFNPPDNTAIEGITLGSDSDGMPTIAVDPALDAIADAVDPVRTDPFQNIVDFSSEVPTGGPGDVIFTAGQGFFLVNNAGAYSAHLTMDKDASGAFVITVSPLIGPPFATLQGTWSATAESDVSIGAPPPGQDWTHWTNASGGTGLVSADVTSNLGVTGASVTFDMGGAIFTATGSGVRYVIDHSSAATTSGASVGITDFLKPLP
jgi:hypothetical protein